MNAGREAILDRAACLHERTHRAAHRDDGGAEQHGRVLRQYFVGELYGDLRTRLVVVEDEMNGLADAARGVRDLFGELQRLLLALAEERAAAGQGHDDLDIEIVGGARRPGGRQGEGGGEGGAELERGKG